MASISKDTSGNRTIQFIAADGKRRSIRLGKVSAKQAESFKLKVETLAAAVATKLPLDSETSKWLGEIGDELAAKLAGVGLMPERSSRTLGEFLDNYLESRKGESKPATIVTIERVIIDLKAFFGDSKNLREIDIEAAEKFKTHYLQRKLAPATTSRRLKNAGMLFKYAARLKLISSNPFAEVRTSNSTATDRQHFISVGDTEKLINVANPTWRTIIALARFGGLRCPSEVLSLKWGHIDFATGRMTVTSPKTEHLEGKGYRVVPIFGILRPYLEDAFELAEPGEDYVVGGVQGATYRKSSQGPNGWVGTNLRTTFEKIIRRAGIDQWPRLFQNLRASRETELMQNHPIHVVTAWIGNTPNIALGHYLQTLDADFEKAIQAEPKSGAISGAVVVQKAVQTEADAKTPETTTATEPRGNTGFRRVVSDPVGYCPSVHVGEAGLEPLATNPLLVSNLHNSNISGAAKSGAVSAELLLHVLANLTAEQKALVRTLLGPG